MLKESAVRPAASRPVPSITLDFNTLALHGKTFPVIDPLALCRDGHLRVRFGNLSVDQQLVGLQAIRSTPRRPTMAPLRLRVSGRNRACQCLRAAQAASSGIPAFSDVRHCTGACARPDTRGSRGDMEPSHWLRWASARSTVARASKPAFESCCRRTSPWRRTARPKYRARSGRVARGLVADDDGRRVVQEHRVERSFPPP